MKQYQAVQQDIKFNIYEFELPEINNDLLVTSIKNTLKKYPRQNIKLTVDGASDYSKFQKPFTVPSGRQIKLNLFNNSSGWIQEFHSLHSELFKRDVVNTNVDELALSQFNNLISRVEQKITEICSVDDPEFNSNTMAPEVTTYWCAVYERGDMIDWHVHGPRVRYTVVHYADTDGVTPLIFKDDTSQNHILSIIPKKGSTIVFSNLVEHMVPQIPTAQERIIVGIDFMYVDKNNFGE